MGFLHGFGKYVALNAVLLVGFFLSGGHWFAFWQPFELLMIVGSVLVMIGYSPLGFQRPKSKAELQIRHSSVFGGCVLGGASTFLMGLIHLMDYLTVSLDTIGALVGATLVGPYYALTIYYSFKPEICEVVPEAESGLNDKDRLAG